MAVHRPYQHSLYRMLSLKEQSSGDVGLGKHMGKFSAHKGSAGRQMVCNYFKETLECYVS